MTMLTHTRGPFKPASYSSDGRDTAGTGTASARMAMIKRVGMWAFTALIVGSALGGIIALKVAFHLSRMNY